jgi:hypothetical protein
MDKQVYPDSDIPVWCKMPVQYHHDSPCMFIAYPVGEWNCALSCIWHKNNENLQDALDSVNVGR